MFKGSGVQLRPHIGPKSVQNRPPRGPGAPETAQDPPEPLPRPSQDLPGSPQDPPRTARDPPRGPQRPPGTPQDPPKDPPRPSGSLPGDPQEPPGTPPGLPREASRTPRESPKSPQDHPQAPARDPPRPPKIAAFGAGLGGDALGSMLGERSEGLPDPFSHSLVDHEVGPSRGRRCGPPSGRPRFKRVAHKLGSGTTYYLAPVGIRGLPGPMLVRFQANSGIG